MILDKIHSSEDVKKLNIDELVPLCGEIRERIVRTVAANGGHLASNLGTVELTVALHRVYDSENDRILFDVGHQSYTHKILTGRNVAFDTLRKKDGISGFPKPNECRDDAFIAGHASDSVSVALGMARARTQLKERYDVVAVIGDGALTGGLAYEGLSDAASSGEPLVIILNDNEMSIDHNVGGMSANLQALRTRSGYLSFKRWYRDNFSKVPALYRFNHRVKEWAKRTLIHGNVFDTLGLYYLGPVDGHDVKGLETLIRWARDLRIPVLVHVVTKKGKGVPYAEAHPDKYHGVGPFNPETGETLHGGESFSDCFGSELTAIAEENQRVVAISAAMCSGTGLTQFRERYPSRLFDVGIAEEHAVSMAAGMAKQGLTPVFAVYSTFLQRSYDMLLHDVALQNLHVVLAVDRAGVVGQDGETHNGTFDAAFLKTVPGMTIYCPASFAELRYMLRQAVNCTDGPVAVRYPRGTEGAYKALCPEAEAVLRTGTDVTIVSYGVLINEVIAAADTLAEKGVSCEVIKLGRIYPNDFSVVSASATRTGKVLFVEEVCDRGCCAEAFAAEILQQPGTTVQLRTLNCGDGILRQGTRGEVLREAGIDAAGIAAKIREWL